MKQLDTIMDACRPFIRTDFARSENHVTIGVDLSRAPGARATDMLRWSIPASTFDAWLDSDVFAEAEIRLLIEDSFKAQVYLNTVLTRLGLIGGEAWA